MVDVAAAADTWASVARVPVAAASKQARARVALWVASDDSSYVTGTEFMVDGGLIAACVTPG